MSTHSTTDARTGLVLRVHFIWRIVFAVLAAAGLLALWTGWVAVESLWQKILVSALLAIAAVLSGIGAAQISRRRHAGRILSLALDYLAFVVCAVLMLHTGEVFIGIDALGCVQPSQ